MYDGTAGPNARWAVAAAGAVISEENKTRFYGDVVATVSTYFRGRQQILVAQSLADVQRAPNSQFMTIEFEGTATIGSDDLAYLEHLLRKVQAKLYIKTNPIRGCTLSVAINMAAGLDYLAEYVRDEPVRRSRRMYALSVALLLLVVFLWFATGSQWKRAVIDLLLTATGDSRRNVSSDDK